MTSNSLLNPIQKRWEVHPPIPDFASTALSAFSPFMRQLLYNRGFEDPESAGAFINGTVNFSTDPFLLKDMEKAIERLKIAIDNGEQIVIYGDYDADGVTSTALLVEFLTKIGIKPRPYIPNRYDEGYGLNEDAIQQLTSEGANLVVTVDCGVRSIKEVELANQLGMDVIISDHHHPGAVLPPALAVIDPKQDGDFYPEKELAGVGLAYKLAQAYLSHYPQDGINADDWLDLVAIGTVVDIAPLRGENRMLVRGGLEKIRKCTRQGIYSLAKVAGVDLEKCNTGDLGFKIGPRLNAAGRLESALTALNLLITQNPLEAGYLAQQLDSYNQDRQDMTEDIREKASRMVLEENPDAVLFFAADPDFSEGVVGLAASRLAEQYYRPSIVGHISEDSTVASCRSIPEFHITAALDACADLLVKYGGHSAAAGFTVRNQDQDTLKNRLLAITSQQLEGVDLQPVLKIDREIKLDYLDRKYDSGIINDLHLLEPTGRGNPKPVFASYNVGFQSAWTVGREGDHLKLRLPACNRNIDAIAFRHGYWLKNLPDKIDIAYCFENNDFNGRRMLQLNIKDIKPSG